MERYLTKKAGLAVAAVIAAVGLLVIAGAPGLEGANVPNMVVLKYIQNRYGPVSFNHAMHVSIAGACGKCHHAHEEKVNSTCSGCHDLKPAAFKASAKTGFIRCSGCHMDSSPDAPGMPGLQVALHKKCFECHVGIGELGSSPAGCVKTCHTKT